MLTFVKIKLFDIDGTLHKRFLTFSIIQKIQLKNYFKIVKSC